MSTPAVSSSSIFQELQSFYQTRQTDLKQLGNDIKSGNLSAAQQDFQALAVLGQGGPFANSEPFSKSSRAQAFNALGEALQAGDLGRAQAALRTLAGNQSSTATAATNTPATVVSLASTQTSTAPPADASSIYQQLQAFRQQRTADLAQLGKDLQGGDLTAAQQDFATLTALGQNGPNQNGQTFQQASRAQNFQAIGQALQNGDLTGAQSAYTALASTFGNQSQQAQTAISAYNPGPAEIVINLAAPSGTNPSSSATTPEVVINLGQPGNSSSGTSGALEIDINPPAASSTNAAAGSTAPEIVINLGATSSTTPSSTTASATPEIVVNLGQGNGTSTASNEEISINLGSGGSGAQLTIEPDQGQNGSLAAPVTINLNPQNNYELIVNLLNSSTTSNSNNALSVSA